jgi:hypothetical protein
MAFSLIGEFHATCTQCGAKLMGCLVLGGEHVPEFMAHVDAHHCPATDTELGGHWFQGVSIQALRESLTRQQMTSDL